MKEIKVRQCSVGKYNLLSNEQSLAFSMGLFEDGKLIEDGDNKALLHYSGDADELEDFKYYSEEDIGWIFEKCFKYANSVRSTTDYEGNAMLFYREYSKDFETMAEDMEKAEKEKIKKQIEKLSKKLDSDLKPYDFRDDMADVIQKKIDKYNKWIASEVEKQSQFKKNTEGYRECSERIAKYKEKMDTLKLKPTTNKEDK